MNSYFLEQAKLHPSIQMQDIIKFCYQATFGAEHLLTDAAYAEKYLRAETDAAEARGGLLAEPISDTFCRVNLAVWKYRGLDVRTLTNFFIQTASEKHGSDPAFLALLDDLIQTVPYTSLPFDQHELNEYVKTYLNKGIRAVHHSAAYREKEKPAYRLILRPLIIPYE